MDTKLDKALEALATAGVGFAVYKNSSNVMAGLSGEGDLDLLVRPRSIAAFRETIESLGGIRTVPHPLYDNAIPSREDWLLAGEGEAIIHLDVATAPVVGRKFYKVYEMQSIDLDDTGPLLRKDASGALGAPLPILSARDEATLALARLAFNSGRAFGPRHVQCPEALAHLLRDRFGPGSERASFDWQDKGQTVCCELVARDGLVLVDKHSLAAIRKSIRLSSGAPAIAPVRDALLHSLRRSGYALVKRGGRLLGMHNAGKRRLQVGASIALIGPDGVGKSTQAEALSDYFGQKLALSVIYMGSNDGSWMGYLHRFRRAMRRTNSETAKDRAARSQSGAKGQRGVLHTHSSAIWRLVIAVQRWTAIRRADRLVRRGHLVIADRWPQRLEAGLFDGPSLAPPPKYILARAMWRVETAIYAAMRTTPTLSIHLDCDFATSHARKPGDIEEEAFNARIALMERMRALDPEIKTVDARKSQNEVFADLAQCIWPCLARLNRR